MAIVRSEASFILVYSVATDGDHEFERFGAKTRVQITRVDP